MHTTSRAVAEKSAQDIVIDHAISECMRGTDGNSMQGKK